MKVAGRRRAATALALSARHIRPGNRSAHRDVIKAEVLEKLLGGRDESALNELGEHYAQKLPLGYRPAMVERVSWHRKQQHLLVLVTASLGVYARPAAKALGFDEVIAVEMESAGGHLTGAMTGPNVRGPEKAVRIQAHINEDPDGQAELWAYGNSSGDTDLLALADHPTWVGARRRA